MKVITLLWVSLENVVYFSINKHYTDKGVNRKFNKIKTCLTILLQSFRSSSLLHTSYMAKHRPIQKINWHSSPPRFPWVIIPVDFHSLLKYYYTILAFSAYFAITYYVLLVLTLILCFWWNRAKLNGVEGTWSQLKSTAVKYVWRL